MKFDFLKLKYLIKTKYKTQEELAKELNISVTSLSNKLNNRVPFSYDEVYILINLLGIDNKDVKDVFFTKEC